MNQRPGLDADATDRVTQQLRRLAASGTTIVAATHDFDVARRVDHCVLLSGGRVVSSGAPADVLTEANVLLDAEVQREGTSLGAAGPALLDLLIIYTLRAWYEREAERGAQGWARALQDPSVRIALESMQQYPARPWTVAQLAAAGGTSRTVFARQFRNLTGEPPMAYLTRWRMTVAARLLRETDLPIESVAARIGYGSPFAFGKAFKKSMGHSPGAYRRANQGDEY
jgi:AraC-like DNA-binding protein